MKIKKITVSFIAVFKKHLLKISYHNKKQIINPIKTKHKLSC